MKDWFLQFIQKVIENPVPWGITIALILVAWGVFRKLKGSPVLTFFQLVASLIPQILKEFRGKAGPAGILNVVVVICMFVLALILFLMKPLSAKFFESEATETSSIIVFCVCAIVFLVSLYVTWDSEQTAMLMPRPEKDQ
jgi:hypothetical protein